MDVLIILVFISLTLLVGALLFLFKGVKEGDYEQGERMALLPLEDDLPRGSGAGPMVQEERETEGA